MTPTPETKSVGKAFGSVGKNVDRVLARLGLSNVREVSVGKSVGTLRREWRINPKTGDLRGVAYRERAPGRKVVYYVGKRNCPEEFRKIYPAFEAWRRTNRVIAGLVVKQPSDTDRA